MASARGRPDPDWQAKVLDVQSDGRCGPRAILYEALKLGRLTGKFAPPPGTTPDMLRTVSVQATGGGVDLLACACELL